MITNHDEVSIGLLRYFLGGYRPSKTARLTMSESQIHGTSLDSQRCHKTGISRMTPPIPDEWVYQSLPAILHMLHVKSQYQSTVKVHGVFPSYSRVNGIFTATTISPSLSLRQRPDR